MPHLIPAVLNNGRLSSGDSNGNGCWVVGTRVPKPLSSPYAPECEALTPCPSVDTAEERTTLAKPPMDLSRLVEELIVGRTLDTKAPACEKERCGGGTGERVAREANEEKAVEEGRSTPSTGDAEAKMSTEERRRRRRRYGAGEKRRADAEGSDAKEAEDAEKRKEPRGRMREEDHAEAKMSAEERRRRRYAIEKEDAEKRKEPRGSIREEDHARADEAEAKKTAEERRRRYGAGDKRRADVEGLDAKEAEDARKRKELRRMRKEGEDRARAGDVETKKSVEEERRYFAGSKRRAHVEEGLDAKENESGEIKRSKRGAREKEDAKKRKELRGVCKEGEDRARAGTMGPPIEPIVVRILPKRKAEVIAGPSREATFSTRPPLRPVDRNLHKSRRTILIGKEEGASLRLRHVTNSKVQKTELEFRLYEVMTRERSLEKEEKVLTSMMSRAFGRLRKKYNNKCLDDMLFQEKRDVVCLLYDTLSDEFKSKGKLNMRDYKNAGRLVDNLFPHKGLGRVIEKMGQKLLRVDEVPLSPAPSVCVTHSPAKVYVDGTPLTPGKGLGRI